MNTSKSTSPIGRKKSNAFGQVTLKKTGIAAAKPRPAASSYTKNPSSSKQEANPFGSVKLRKTNSSLGSSQHDKEKGEPVYEKGALKPTSNNNQAKLSKEGGGDGTLLVQGLSTMLDQEKSNKKFLKQTNEMLNTLLAMNEDFVARRRLSVSDNDVVSLLKDPRHQRITIASDPRFDHIKPSLVVGFAEDLRLNLNLRQLTMCSIGLGNEFLSAISDSIRCNYVLQELDLSHNSFTNDALVDFCFGLAENKGLSKVMLGSQHSPIFSHREDLAIEALSKNKTCQTIYIEFQSQTCQAKVKSIETRNKSKERSIANLKKKVTSMLETELAAATERQKKRKEKNSELHVSEGDMPYLYELYERANRLKLPYETTSSTSSSSATSLPGLSKQKTSLAKIATSLLTPDGAFLTPEFIGKHLVEGSGDQSLTFEFNNQSKIFKRFTPSDPARETIVRLLVDAIVQHARAPDITHLNLANAMIGDDFLQVLCSVVGKASASSLLLPNLHLLNLESNMISDKGVSALAQVLRCNHSWKYLQAIKLENQYRPLSSDVEGQLSKGLSENKSVIKLSLRIRNIYERQEIGGFVARNVDFLRQARVWHGKKTGTTKQRARNRVEQLFDRIAANDAKITEVELVADRLFLSLHPTERIKAAQSFATNSTVLRVKLNKLELGDAFGCELAKSIKHNTTLEVVDIEQNKLGSDGQIALVDSLGTNRSLLELKLRHQSKSMSSSCEESIPGILTDNDLVVKLSIDVRSTMARNSVEKKLRQNQTLRRKQLAAMKKK